MVSHPVRVLYDVISFFEYKNSCNRQIPIPLFVIIVYIIINNHLIMCHFTITKQDIDSEQNNCDDIVTKYEEKQTEQI
jgi:hypothetical protein